MDKPQSTYENALMNAMQMDRLIGGLGKVPLIQA
jgi:hypothetical protein